MTRPPSAPTLDLRYLGPTPQSALRRLVDEFEVRGWRDDGETALAVVRFLDAQGGSAPTTKVARVVPQSFLRSNGLQRRKLESFLLELAAVDHRGESDRPRP
jgi:hypothetical protein